MNPYELVTVLKPELQDEALQGGMGRVSKYVADQGGEVDSQEFWGRRKLAYPINHLREGNYIFTVFHMEATYTKELESSLRINEDVMRHLLVRREE